MKVIFVGVLSVVISGCTVTRNAPLMTIDKTVTVRDVANGNDTAAKLY